MSDDRLGNALHEYWGYDSFRPLQEAAMRAVLAGRDSLVVLPTGGGKSLCYQAPAVCLDGTAIVVSPLISLMKDQVDALQACGIPAAFLNSTLTADEKWQVKSDLVEGRLKLLYVAPEGLSLAGLVDVLEDVNVSFFAIDEAHCVSMWGHDFRPHYRELSVLRDRFPNLGVHAYTATATQRVRDDIVTQLKLNRPETLVGSFDRPNLTYRVAPRSDLTRQVTEVLDRHPNESGIVYCITRKDVDALHAELSALGYKSAPYHAGMSDQQRQANQDAFIEDRVHTIVATIAFGMGINKPNVRCVVHAGMPKSLENYQQESGRAGRDGLEAECCLIHSGQDLRTWEFLISKQPEEGQQVALRSLQRMADYCAGVTCRHRQLVRHFGQDLDADCQTACDVCLSDLDLVDDALVVAQKILSSVYRQGERFGAGYTARVVTGSTEARIVENRHDELSTHGILEHEPRSAVMAWISQLVSQGFMEKSGEYSVLKITPRGWRLLKGECQPKLLRAERRSKSSRSTGKAAKGEAASWKGVDRDLFEILRELRMEYASQRGVPPYIVFGDASLRDMARLKPTTIEEFQTVYGVGTKKCAEFGDEFVRAIVRYLSSAPEVTGE
ncbi:MAG: DNA helicase RecQ [Planctomycetota bacterium]|nr:MAG: DNA helicase RecQ [Planctomycetota bacterium]REK27297.1 MAG: DNA helicase RecQ [Planctomycetota bacterium]REK36682.1 MAG: DNA helicase RecQ [Planctomycetota bacterium]